MYLQILKKDLKRKRAMNIILLVFIILSSMFVSSSVSNIISVTTALDSYFEMAEAPDYFAATMNKSSSVEIEESLENEASIDSIKTEEIFFLSRSNIFHKGEQLNAVDNTQVLQSDKDISMNYFLDDGSIIEKVNSGEVYMTGYAMENVGLESGDKITIDIEGESHEFTIAGGFKDAVLGSSMNNMARYIISSEDFEAYTSNEMINEMYGGKFCYIHTSNMEKMMSEISDISSSFIFAMDRGLLKFTYVFDMIVTGILLVVSLILIAIAFVVLRFSISFTLSEEFREIGVMKAIGISNLKIRGLYLTKYAALSIIGALIGLVFSFPFGKMLMSISSKSVIISNQNPIFINILCAVFVIAVILLFCFSCTRKVKKMTPIDAVRSGQTGERFRKKSIMSLSKSKLPATAFLAANDIVSSPKRYSIITFTFSLCLSLLLILSATVTTLNSDTLMPTFGFVECHATASNGDIIMRFMVDGGHEKLEVYLEDMEETLAENDMPAKCVQEMGFTFTVTHGEYEENIQTFQGTGTTMDMYEYTAGTAPQSTNEIAITRIAADKINADIGDTVTIKTIDGDKDYIITAFFQTMNMQGSTMRLHEDEEVNYVQVGSSVATQITFTDDPDDAEIERRIEKIKEIYPEFEDVTTSAEWVKGNVGVADTLASVKSMVAILTIVLAALITVLMERSFIAKEKGEIALLKAIGARNNRIYVYHTIRFAMVGFIAAVIAEIAAMPLTHLCVDPIFKMMGLELAVDYVINPLEMFITLPLTILITTIVSAFLTSIYTRKIKSSDTTNIE